jgi:hypothetical protein
MPRIRDLGVTTVPFARRKNKTAGHPGYWMCLPSGSVQSVENDDEDVKCHPTPPKCHPTPPGPAQPCDPTSCNPSQCNPTPKDKKNARGLPREAVLLLREQLQQVNRQQLHS